MIARLSLLALVVAAAVGSAWLLERLTAAAPAAASGYHEADYYLEDFTTVTMAADGRPKHKLYAVYMAHYPGDDASELLRPGMEIFRDEKPPLHIQAEKGWAMAEGKVVLLQGDVRLWEYDAAGRLALDVNTSEVRVLLNDDYAETDKYATITTPNSTISGTGMRASLADSRLQVINHEKTTIFP